MARQYDLKKCERGCGKTLPPRSGPGRPRKYCTDCEGPRGPGTGYDKFGKRKPPKAPAPVAVNLGGASVEIRQPVPLERDERGLDARGAALWDEMAERMPGPLHRALLLEACRLADRGERMHALLRGERGAWAVLKLPDFLAKAGYGAETDEIEISVNIGSIAIEARNTATALKAIMSELRMAMKQAPTEDESEDAVDGILGDLKLLRGGA